MNAALQMVDEHGYADVAEPQAAPHPLANLARVMRGRWRMASTAAVALGLSLAGAGYLAGSKVYESQAILRLYPQESNILYRTADDSVLKTFDSFVKAETSTVASHPVMERALSQLPPKFADLTDGMTVADLTGSVEIKRSDSLIVLTTKSRDAEFAAAKLAAVVGAYQALQAEGETERSAVRLAELQGREASLLKRRDEIRLQTLEVGGEFGIDALTKAHVEKVAQIEAISARKAEVEATLVTLKAKEGTSSADMSDDEIMRATLLDRALADLNFDRAKREAELATLITRYTEGSRQVSDKRDEIAVIDKAMSERREQIKVLGQTGALTDTSQATPEASIAEIQALFEKVSGQLDVARKEARDLNAKRATLSALQQDADENRKLLEETRNALEVIRLEAGRALPGYSVLMSPPSVPAKASDDSRKTNIVAGFGLGAVLAFGGSLVAALMSRRLRHSDGLGRWSARLPVLLTAAGDRISAAQANRLRNAIKLRHLRTSRIAGRGQIIAIAPLDKGNAQASAHALAESFARSGLRTLIIDADLHTEKDNDTVNGWREALAGHEVETAAIAPSLSRLETGVLPDMTCGSIGVNSLRAALNRLAADQDVVVLACASLHRSVATELILSEADFALAQATPDDLKATVATSILRFDNLPRQGGAVLFTGARANDPGLTH